MKGLDFESIPVHLVKDGGEQNSAEYVRLNPMRVVPTLENGETVITQSLAIIEYLEALHPEPALIPSRPVDEARVRALSYAVAIDIQPLNNLRVLQYLKNRLGNDQEAVDAWYRTWVEKGFAAVEQMLISSPETGRFCHGDSPSLADICLVPQIYNAERFRIDMSKYPTLVRIDEACQMLDAFQHAAPENQPDAPAP